MENKLFEFLNIIHMDKKLIEEFNEVTLKKVIISKKK